MPRFKAFLANLLTVIVSVCVTVLIAEIALRFFPLAWALPVEPPTVENPIQRYVANSPFVFSIGWNFEVVIRGRSNAQGFLADYDYDATAKTPLVAVAGDSFVDGLWVPFADTLTGRLQAALADRGRAYMFAQTGSPLSQYVAYAQHACRVYRPERLVVVIVPNDFDESLFMHRKRNGIHHLYPRPDGAFDYRLTPLPDYSLAERIARNSAVAIYFMRNVGINQALFRWGINRAQIATVPGSDGGLQPLAMPERIAEGERVVSWFLDTLPQAACLAADEIVLVVDSLRPAIYDDAALAAASDSYFGQLRAKLIASASAHGFKVVDTNPLFRASFARDGVRFEYANDAHWNPHAHAVVMAAVRKALADWAPLAGNARQ